MTVRGKAPLLPPFERSAQPVPALGIQRVTPDHEYRTAVQEHRNDGDVKPVKSSMKEPFENIWRLLFSRSVWTSRCFFGSGTFHGATDTSSGSNTSAMKPTMVMPSFGMDP